MKIAATNIDNYILNQPASAHASLEKLRQTIKAAAPEAEEVISYGMPSFKYHGMLVGFAAAKEHYGFYPWNSTTIDEFKEDLKPFGTSKGAIRFPAEKPLPIALIKKIVKARMKENLEKEKMKVIKKAK
jgi:uncharacterized protein YdhG (YjbR/CyaY superfamily)